MASNPQEILERYSQVLLRAVQSNAQLAREMDAAQAAFRRHEMGALDAEATRRFREWFLFERLLEKRQETPAFAFHESAVGEISEGLQDGIKRFPEAVFGVFEVDEDLDGVWSFQDLLTQREYFVRAPFPQAAGPTPTRNFVGRLFPWKEEHIVSPSCARFLPEGPLSEALYEDLRKARQGHAGNRVAQTALEPIVWPAAPQTRGGHSATLQELEQQWNRLCAGHSSFSFARVCEVFKTHPHGNPAAAILERLAFESKIDLDQVRLLLLQISQVLNSGQRAAQAQSTEDALRAFDEGKARGEDLDILFAKLEQDLGLEPDADDDQETAPTVPELTPLVEEFLWETKTAHGGVLRKLFRYLEEEAEPPVAHLEEITAENLRRYLSLVYPMSVEAQDSANTAGLLEALRRFGLWSDMEQGTQIAGVTEQIQKEFSSELPRIARCNLILHAKKAVAGLQQFDPWEITNIDPEKAELRLVSIREPQERTVKLPPDLVASLALGDVVFSAGDHLQAVLPAHSKEFLS